MCNFAGGGSKPRPVQVDLSMWTCPGAGVHKLLQELTQHSNEPQMSKQHSHPFTSEFFTMRQKGMVQNNPDNSHLLFCLKNIYMHTLLFFSTF